MSNPNINRWGLNLFWYRFWYVDKNMKFTITQDELFNKIILTYVHYGLFFNKNIFINNYWWPLFNNIIKTYESGFNSKYFRTIEYKNKVVDETKFCTLRNKIKNLYFSKIWIIRYQNWIIINFYAYQPLAKKRNKIVQKYKNVNFYLSKSNQDRSKIYYRLKFYLTFFFYQNLSINPYYKF